MWLSCEPEGLARWLSWDAFCTRCESTVATIKALGGEVGVRTDGEHDGRHSIFESCLKTSLDERGAGRGDWQISHDAEMLVNLYISRSRNPANQEKLWPGAVIVSPDTHLADSYRAAIPTNQDKFPAAITVSQCAAILAKCSDPATAEILAKALSSEVSTRAVLNRAVAVPIETAIFMARSLKNTAVSDVVLNAMNVSLEAILKSESLDDRESPEFSQDLASRVLAERHRRLERVSQEQRHALTKERHEADTHRVRREAQMEERESAHRREAEQERVRSSRLEVRNTELEGEIADVRARTKRQIQRVFLATVLCVVVLSATIILFVSDVIGRWGLVVGLAGTVMLIVLSVDWYKNDRRWYEIGIPSLTNAGWLIINSVTGNG